MKERLIYFDCEFTELSRNGELISLGLCSTDDIRFYAEFTDYDKSKTDGNDWMQDNVISNLKFDNKNDFYYTDNETTLVKGNKENIKEYLLKWLEQFGNIEFVSDVCHYDMVFLIDLICGIALNIPKNITACCHDINSDIAKYYKISDNEAFDICREDLLDKSYVEKNKNSKHNALYDAVVIKIIDSKLRNIKQGM